ncbi:hypothetical protein D5S17_12030 [Pseudonocardiaceae bacterium YIM PH 21723]|nr:hypothetical protein D5S17_12030 [Pseudonocardiaceae bacterium YIM PH 21723]
MLSPLQIQNIDRMFSVFDHDGNGLLEWADFELMHDDVYRSFPGDPESVQGVRLRTAYQGVWDFLRKSADKDRDQVVSKDEFRVAYDADAEFSVQLVRYWEDVADALFDIADGDADGYIDEPELTGIYTAARVPGEVAAIAFRAMDGDGDGRIDAAEWRTSVQALFTSSEESALLKGV